MPITPLDIEEKEFRSSLFGYHRGEVDTFLAELGEELQRLIKENHALKDELKRKEERLARLLEEEAEIRQALVSAQRLAEEIKDQARREAELIRKEAELEAERIRQEAEETKKILAQEISELIRKKTEMTAELRGLLRGWLDLLESTESPEKALETGPEGKPTTTKEEKPAAIKEAPPSQESKGEEPLEEFEEGPRLE